MLKFLSENKELYSGLKALHNIYWRLVSNSWKLKRKDFGKKRSNFNYSIGIVTYVDRYEKFFKRLLINLVTIFPEVEFVICVNGYYDKKIQHAYLEKIKEFTGKFQNVKVIDFVQPQSLSKLWNLLILNSSNNKIFIFNDDIKIAPWFRSNLERSNILNEEVALINRSWSHFLISKSVIKKIGYFDQRFPAVGNEDQDYECRLVFNNISTKSFTIYGLKNIIFKTTNFSYGKNIKIVNTKYVNANRLFFDSKWNIYNEQVEGSKFVEILDSFVLPKPGMETPIFYDLELLKPNGNIIK